MLYEVMWTACSRSGECFRVFRDGYDYSVEMLIPPMWERISDRTESFHDALKQMNQFVEEYDKKLEEQLKLKE